LNKLYKMGFYARCKTADKFSVLLLLDQLDRGEAEALIQAQEKDALYFVGDDRRARNLAELMGKRPIGTLRLLARLHLEGRAEQLSTLVDILRHDLDFRVSEELVQQADALAAEPI
jgi:predicted nucleic acid-binding protein